MNLRFIKTEEEYNIALKKIDELIDSVEGTPQDDELELVSLLVWDYEEKHYPIEKLSPIQAITVRMEELNLKQKDLVAAIGDKSRVSDILSKKRKLTIKMIRQLNHLLSIPVETLMQDY